MIAQCMHASAVERGRGAGRFMSSEVTGSTRLDGDLTVRANVTDESGRAVELEHLRLTRPEDGAEAEAAQEQAGQDQAAREQAPAPGTAGSATSIRPIGS